MRAKQQTDAGDEVARVRNVAAGRAAAAAMCLLTLLVVSGCGDSEGDTSGSSAASGSAKGTTVGASFFTFASNPFLTTEERLTVKAAEEAGMKILPPTDAKSDTGQQLTDIQNLISAGAKALVMLPNDAHAVCPAVKAAKDNGIPTVGQDLAAECPETYMNLGTDGVAMGEQGCEYIGEAIGGKGTVLDIAGNLSSSNGRDRARGFDNCIKEKFPEVKVITQGTDWSGAKAADILQAQLVQHPDLNGIFMGSDTQFLPALVQVLKTKDRYVKKGEPGYIAMAGVDGGGPYGLDQIRAGYYGATISQPLLEFGERSMEYVKRALEGEAVTAGSDGQGGRIEQVDGVWHHYLAATVVTEKNVDDPSLWANQPAALEAFGGQ